MPERANAQERRVRGTLFSSKALDRANYAQSKGLVPDKFNWQLDSLGFLATVGDGLRFDSIDEVGMARERRSGTINLFRSVYNNYDSSARGTWYAYEESGELENVAQRVALYQVSSDVGGYILRSSFGHIIQETLRDLSYIREMVTFKLARRSDGSLRFRNGETKWRMLEISFTTSARRGIEPRLRLYENIMLKYDIFEQQPLIEYNINF